MGSLSINSLRKKNTSPIHRTIVGQIDHSKFTSSLGCAVQVEIKLNINS